MSWGALLVVGQCLVPLDVVGVFYMSALPSSQPWGLPSPPPANLPSKQPAHGSGPTLAALALEYKQECGDLLVPQE